MDPTQAIEVVDTLNESVNGPIYLGTTPPVSYAASTQTELRNNGELIQFLESRAVFETENGQWARENAINSLSKIIIEWVVSVGMKKNVAPEFLAQGGGVQLRVYGSQRLGVHSPTADIGRLVFDDLNCS